MRMKPESAKNRSTPRRPTRSNSCSTGTSRPAVASGALEVVEQHPDGRHEAHAGELADEAAAFPAPSRADHPAVPSDPRRRPGAARPGILPRVRGPPATRAAGGARGTVVGSRA